MSFVPIGSSGGIAMKRELAAWAGVWLLVVVTFSAAGWVLGGATPWYPLTVAVVSFVYILVVGPVMRMATVSSGHREPIHFLLAGLSGAFPASLAIFYMLSHTGFAAVTFLLGGISGLLFWSLRFPKNEGKAH